MPDPRLDVTVSVDTTRAVDELQRLHRQVANAFRVPPLLAGLADYEGMTITRRYRQHVYIKLDWLEDGDREQKLAFARANAEAQLLDYIAQHHLRRVTDVTVELHEQGSLFADYPPQLLLIAECSANGIPPAPKKRRRAPWPWRIARSWWLRWRFRRAYRREVRP